MSKLPRILPWTTLAWAVPGPFETEFETEKGDVGLDEYETRSWSGWHHHIAMCLLGGAFLLGLQQLGGKRCPGSPVPRCTGWCGKCCPGNGSDRRSCCCGWRIRSYATSGRAAPTRDAAPPAVNAGWSHHLKRVVVVLEPYSTTTTGGNGELLSRGFQSNRKTEFADHILREGTPQYFTNFQDLNDIVSGILET